MIDVEEHRFVPKQMVEQMVEQMDEQVDDKNKVDMDTIHDKNEEHPLVQKQYCYC
jgi:hypothetical protein